MPLRVNFAEFVRKGSMITLEECSVQSAKDFSFFCMINESTLKLLSGSREGQELFIM